MPSLVLTAEQAEQVQEVLYAQNGCKVGYLAVLNWHFDFSTGERIAELSFIALDWQDATRICRQARKLAEQEKSAGGNQTNAFPQTNLTGPPPARAGRPFPS